MIKAILIDDEVACTESLRLELEMYCENVQVIGCYNSAKDGLIAIKNDAPDVVFLDIEMPWMNGFELLLALGEFDFSVIFVTAYDEFAIKAFRFNAIDYLMKPIKKDDLIQAVNKLLNHHVIRVDETFLTNINNREYSFEKLALPTMDGLSFVELSDILYCESDNNYTHVVLTSGERRIVSKTLKSIGVMLDDLGFFRSHQSFLVNLKHVSRYIKGQGGEIVLNNGKHIPVARSKRAELLERVRRS